MKKYFIKCLDNNVVKGIVYKSKPGVYVCSRKYAMLFDTYEEASEFARKKLLHGEGSYADTHWNGFTLDLGVLTL